MPLGKITRSPQVSVSGSLQLLDSDVALSGEHRYAAERRDGLSQPGTGDHGQDTSLTRERTRRQCSDPDLAQLTERERGLDRRTGLAEVDVHLRDGLVTHDDHAMAEL